MTARVKSKGTRTKQNTTNKGEDKMKTTATVKPMEETATDKVVNMMKKNPNMSGVEIAKQTGVKTSTVYAIQSRKRREAEAKKKNTKATKATEATKTKTTTATKNKAVKPKDAKISSVTANKQDKQVVVADVENNNSDYKMMQISDEVLVPLHASKEELFTFITGTYLDKIAETDDMEVAKKYNALLLDVLASAR